MTAVERPQAISLIDRNIAKALLAPASVALVGASDTMGKTTARPLQFMQAANFAGRIYPINPARELVMGIPAYPSLRALPEVPEFVFIMTGTDSIIDVVRDCGEIGVTAACVLAGGFGEEGPVGLAREQELIQVAQASGVRLIGPNSIGVANPRNGFLATANAAFGESEIPTGSVFVASQSGSVIGALMTRAKAVGIGFAGMVSTGSEIDLTVGEICEAVLDDPGITSFALFLESLENAAELAKFALLAAARGKGVSVLKLGRSDAAAQLSVSHTGALAGADDEAQAFFEACGFVRVDLFEALVESTALHGRVRKIEHAGRPRVGVITSTGGGAAVVVDQLETRNVSVVRPSTHVFEQLAEVGVDVHENLIVDLTLAGTKHEKVVAALKILQHSGEFDVIVFVIGSSARSHPELAVKGVTECDDGPTPVCAWAVPDALESLRMLQGAGIPAFRTPESCADALASMLERKVPQARALENFGSKTQPSGAAEVLDEVESGRVLERLGLPRPEYWVRKRGQREPPADAYPVVVKALSSDLPHKSDAGAVLLNVRDDDELERAYERIVANVAEYDPDIKVEQFLIQEMVSNGVLEALIGYRVSDIVGPTVVLAAGGVNVEIYHDSALRLAPVTREEAKCMVDEVKAFELARGYRGGVEGDLEALVDAVVAVSDLAMLDSDILEAEINPVLVKPRGEGIKAVDALVRRRKDGAGVVKDNEHRSRKGNGQ